MTKKKPTKRQAKRKLRDIEHDVATGGDVEVNINVVGIDRAENVDDVDRDDGVVIRGRGTCDVDGCESPARVDADRCGYHDDGDPDDE